MRRRSERSGKPGNALEGLNHSERGLHHQTQCVRVRVLLEARCPFGVGFRGRPNWKPTILLVAQTNE